MESLEFSEDEIKRQLAALGYFNVPEQRMKQFRKGTLLFIWYYKVFNLYIIYQKITLTEF